MTCILAIRPVSLVFLAVITAAFASAIRPNTARASTLLLDDFESYSTGTWPSAWDAKWHAVDDPSNNGIRIDPEDLTNQVLKLFGIENWSASATQALPFTENFVVSSRVWNGSEPRWDGWGRGSAALEGVVTLFTFYADGILHAGDNLAIPYETERWYDVKVHYQRTGNSATGRYWLDGDLLGETPLTIAFPNAPTSRLELNGGSTAYFDDVTVTSVPEPGCLALAVFGVLALAWPARRARRR